MDIVGRKAEIEEIRLRYESKKPEFVAVYGRRRVGKTYLIKEVFKDRFAFQHTGMAPYKDGSMSKTSKSEQIYAFYLSMVRYGLEGKECPKNWMDAFFMLEQLLEYKYNGERQVVFIDELPWMDTPKSGFMAAFENFWNGWCNYHDSIMLVVCGSASGWMTDKLIHDTGGFCRRATDVIKLEPFTLGECEEFYRMRNIRMTRYDIVEGYMAMGGIPYYMNLFMPGMSMAQNIDRLFFDRKAKLKDEFSMLFRSVFAQADLMQDIVRFLSRRHAGYTRDEVARHIGMTSGGTLTHVMSALEESGYVTRYVPFGQTLKNEHYKLSDNFCWFYLHYLDGDMEYTDNYWQSNHLRQSVTAWRGVAFEEVCFYHIGQIKKALGISGVNSRVCQYLVPGSKAQEGMQIDMLIDRDDNVLNMCEMKFTRGEFSVDAHYYDKINARIERLMQCSAKSIHTVLVTTAAPSRNEYLSAFQKVVVLDDLF